jgi:hypothetical protein
MTENFTRKTTENTESKDNELMDVINCDLNLSDSCHIDNEIFYDKNKSSPEGKYENFRASKGTHTWQKSFETAEAQVIDSTGFLDIPNVNFSVSTPNLLTRGESNCGTRKGVSSLTPEDQPTERIRLCRFSHNLANLSPHLSEDLADSPLTRLDSLQVSPSLNSDKPLQCGGNKSALWESIFSDTNSTHDFGNFEVQTSLLNSLSEVANNDDELSAVADTGPITSIGTKVLALTKQTIDTPEIGKGCNVNMYTQEEDSVIVPRNMCVSDNESRNIETNNHCKSIRKPNESTLQVRSALRAVNGQNNVKVVNPSCSKDPAKDRCVALSMTPQVTRNPSQDQGSQLTNLDSVCVDKENQSCDKREECSRQSPMSLIERLRQRLDNHPDSYLIHKIKYGPLSVKPIK